VVEEFGCGGESEEIRFGSGERERERGKGNVCSDL
jgi:hypothetical protein